MLMIGSSDWNKKWSHHKSATKWSTGGSFSKHHGHGATHPVWIGRVYVAGQVRRLKVAAVDGRWVHLEDAAVPKVMFQRDVFMQQDIGTFAFQEWTGPSTGWLWWHSMGFLKFRRSHWFTIEMEISRTIAWTTWSGQATVRMLLITIKPWQEKSAHLHCANQFPGEKLVQRRGRLLHQSA